MASASPSPSPISAGVSSDQLPVTKFELFGAKMEIPLPKWAVSSLAVLLIAAGISAGIYMSIAKVNDSIMMTREQAEVFEETSFHQTEPNQLKVSKDDTLDDLTAVTLNYFKSDGCVQLVRRNQTAATSEGIWLFGAHPHSNLHSKQHQISLNSKPTESFIQQQGAGYELTSFNPDLEDGAQPRLIQNGKCLNPHPGKFTLRNEKLDQCSVKTTRTFSDGCSHFQLFNACRGTWEVSANGAPLLHWTHCIH